MVDALYIGVGNGGRGGATAPLEGGPSGGHAPPKNLEFCILIGYFALFRLWPSKLLWHSGEFTRVGTIHRSCVL